MPLNKSEWIIAKKRRILSPLKIVMKFINSFFFLIFNWNASLRQHIKDQLMLPQAWKFSLTFFYYFYWTHSKKERNVWKGNVWKNIKRWEINERKLPVNATICYIETRPCKLFSSLSFSLSTHFSPFKHPLNFYVSFFSSSSSFFILISKKLFAHSRNFSLCFFLL